VRAMELKGQNEVVVRGSENFGGLGMADIFHLLACGAAFGIVVMVTGTGLFW
jgi:hypothetical protein